MNTIFLSGGLKVSECPYQLPHFVLFAVYCRCVGTFPIHSCPMGLFPIHSQAQLLLVRPKTKNGKKVGTTLGTLLGTLLETLGTLRDLMNGVSSTTPNL